MFYFNLPLTKKRKLINFIYNLNLYKIDLKYTVRVERTVLIIWVKTVMLTNEFINIFGI